MRTTEMVVSLGLIGRLTLLIATFSLLIFQSRGFSKVVSIKTYTYMYTQTVQIYKTSHKVGQHLAAGCPAIAIICTQERIDSIENNGSRQGP